MVRKSALGEAAGYTHCAPDRAVAVAGSAVSTNERHGRLFVVRQSLAKRSARANAQLREHLAEVPLDGARA